MADAIYLRKSRMDMEAERHGAGDTLERHRRELMALSKGMGLNITHIYQEVVSGETITARPQMQQLLHDVEAGQYEHVVVMEVERLARGDTLDQGVVSRAFRFSGTKIVTPKKTYDPNSEFDEEYFEFGLFMSRREYKTINRRQQAGRLASVNEGKWPSNKAPYGYDRKKLEDQKGWTLVPNEHAKVVASVYQWFTEGLVLPDGSTSGGSTTWVSPPPPARTGPTRPSSPCSATRRMPGGSAGATGKRSPAWWPARSSGATPWPRPTP